jgi:hypothetical protein
MGVNHGIKRFHGISMKYEKAKRVSVLPFCLWIKLQFSCKIIELLFALCKLVIQQ